MSPPEVLSGSVDLFGLRYPAYRFAIIAVGLVVAAGLYVLIHRTRVGMLIRAGATHPDIVAALGVNVRAPQHARVRAGCRARRRSSVLPAAWCPPIVAANRSKYPS